MSADSLLALHAATAAGWPAIHTARVGGWTLRASRGFTGRANSISTAGQLGVPLVDAMPAIRQFYAAHGLPMLAQVVVGSPADTALRAAGWRDARPAEVDAWAMSRRLGVPAGTEGARVVVDTRLTRAWTSIAYPTGLVDGATEVLAGGRVGFALVADGGRPVAAARGCVCGDWLGVSCVRVDQAFRRRGFGTRVVQAVMAWGSRQGASQAYLEVLADNVAARAAYRRLGFRDRYAYRYLTAE